ncbi:hypothetical protein Tco_0014807 [Tanacetum coccineum]
MSANENGDDGPPPARGGDLPVPDLRTIEELCQPTLDGQGGPIAPIAIQATNFRLKNDMIQQVQNSCPFRGPGDDANKHLDKFLHVTQSMKVNGVADDALRLYLFPYSLQHRAAEWFDRLPRNSITTFDQMAKIFLGKYFPPSMVTKLRNDITNFRQEPDESLFEAWERYKLSIDRCPNHNMLPVTQIDTFYNGYEQSRHYFRATKSDEVIKFSVEDLTNLRVFFRFLNDDSTSIDDDSFSIDDIDYVEASPPDSELVSLEEVKDFHTEDGEIEDDILREKLSKINLLIAKIKAIKDNPTPSSDFVTKSSSTFSNSFLEETNTFDNSIPESETFCFDLEENSSGNTTTLSDYSLPDYEAFYFYDDHIKEKSSGSTTTHSDFSLSKYDSFIFDLSINPFPPADRSNFYHEEFADKLAHVISPPEYDCFYFKSEPDPGELTSIVDSGIRENLSSMTNVNLPFEDAQSPLLAYVVWIFLSFLTYPVTPPYLLSCGNEDTIFDPGISVYHSFIPSVSHRSGTFMKFNVYPNHLNESPMEILSSTCSPMDQ